MLEVDLAEAFQAGATRIARASCSRLFVYREALAAPVPSRTVAGESSIDLRETAIDIGRIEVEAVQDLISVMVRGATSILQRGGVPKQNRSSDEAMKRWKHRFSFPPPTSFSYSADHHLNSD